MVGRTVENCNMLIEAPEFLGKGRVELAVEFPVGVKFSRVDNVLDEC